MKTKLLILFLVLLVPNGNLFLQEIPDCWCLPYIGANPEKNYDSVYIDTCDITYDQRVCDSIANDWSIVREIFEQKRFYAKRYWRVTFDVDVITLPKAPDDTLIVVSWTDFDEKYEKIRYSFQLLEEKYGKLEFIKCFPRYVTGKYSRIFFIKLNNYVNAYQFEDECYSIENVSCSFISEYRYVVNIIDSNNVDFLIRTYPNPVNDILKIEIQNLFDNDINIEMYDILGNCVYKGNKNHDDKSEFTINTVDYCNGFYFLKVNDKVFKILVFKQ